MFTQPDQSNAADRLAFLLSEMHNDRAPIGWERYRFLAKLLLSKLPILETVMNPAFLDPDFQPGRQITAGVNTLDRKPLAALPGADPDA